MHWNNISKDLSPGRYIVKTYVPHYTLKGKLVRKAILEVDMHYDEEGKQRWSCKNQKPLEYLKDVEN